MPQAFIIMQIGNEEMDGIYRNVFVPVLKDSCGLEPKRVDKHNRGGLIKNEIVDFIKTSDIILADLTNERPNCYLEVGYAMGLGKNMNLILTCRENHDSASPNFKPGGPRIHFDLNGYEILFWNPESIEAFKKGLKIQIKKRLEMVRQSAKDTNSASETQRYDKIQHLEKLIKEVSNISITPIFPVSKRESEFRAKEILRESNILHLEKLDSGHTIQIPMQKIKAILPAGNNAATLELDGRLQLLSLTSEWRFFPESPDDNDLGLGKRGSITDRRVKELQQKVRSRFFLLNALDKFQRLDWQIFYDDDGKYIRMPDRPSDQILCFGGRSI